MVGKNSQSWLCEASKQNMINYVWIERPRKMLEIAADIFKKLEGWLGDKSVKFCQQNIFVTTHWCFNCAFIAVNILWNVKSYIYQRGFSEQRLCLTDRYLFAARYGSVGCQPVEPCWGNPALTQGCLPSSQWNLQGNIQIQNQTKTV